MSGAAPVESAYAQLLSVGLVWISLHCVGMCGPILTGFDVAGVHRGLGPVSGAGRVLAYQAGRAVTYSLLGAVAGLLGAGMKAGFSLAGGVLAVVAGTGIVASIGWKLVPRSRPSGLVRLGKPREAPLDRVLARARLFLLPLASSPSVTSTFLLGAAMGLLPCMITGWALGLAAVTGSFVHGAVLMVLLVAMTTPVLLGATLLPRAFASRLGRARVVLPRLLLSVSGVWLVLAGLASLDVIEHAHLGFAAGGRHWMVMFW